MAIDRALRAEGEQPPPHRPLKPRRLPPAAVAVK